MRQIAPFSKLSGFKSCPRVGGIFLPGPPLLPASSFQVVPPCGGHPVSAFASSFSSFEFQVVPPCGGHQARCWQYDLRIVSFKSCPRVGGIPCSPECFTGCGVSSRAPVWGASATKKAGEIFQIVFQVVPPCGGHPAPVAIARSSICFKSCPRVGGISGLALRYLSARSFKSCPRVGGIRGMITVSPAMAMFQVVPPCGGHPSELVVNCGPFEVSSRAPVWGASGLPLGSTAMREFQVVPPCGGHPHWCSFPPNVPLFQVVPPCGGHL